MKVKELVEKAYHKSKIKVIADYGTRIVFDGAKDDVPDEVKDMEVDFFEPSFDYDDTAIHLKIFIFVK